MTEAEDMEGSLSGAAACAPARGYILPDMERDVSHFIRIMYDVYLHIRFPFVRMS